METSESVGEYLEALWISEENGNPTAKIIWIAKQVGVSPPSTVEMLKRVEKLGYVKYIPRKGVTLSNKGKTLARQIIRNHRLIETLMKKSLKIDIDETIACGIEHHMNREFADALCTLLNHPTQCPHKNEIPKGKCCK